MARMSKIEQARWDGFNRACRIAKEQGVDGLLEEQKRRGISGFSVAIPEADLLAQMEEWKRNILQTVLLVTAATLRDEFDFGAKRMSRFIKRFNEKSDCLAEDYLTWNDMAIDMAAEVGIDFELPYFAKEKGEKTA